jgi:hypothetical protein
MDLFFYTIDGCIIDEGHREEFARGLEKRPKLNPNFQNVYLLPDGSIVREEDKIIAAQRIWKERAYAPPGTLFSKRGYMYRKLSEIERPIS